jgi:hypothetical protein
MGAYKPGSIRQDPVTLTVAVCTNLSGLEPDGEHDWLYLNTRQGAYYTTDEQLADWADLYTP